MKLFKMMGVALIAASKPARASGVCNFDRRLSKGEVSYSSLGEFLMASLAPARSFSGEALMEYGRCWKGSLFTTSS